MHGGPAWLPARPMAVAAVSASGSAVVAAAVQSCRTDSKAANSSALNATAEDVEAATAEGVWISCRCRWGLWGVHQNSQPLRLGT